MDNQQGPRGTLLNIRGSLNGRRIWGRINVCIVAVVQLLSHVRLFAIPWTAALQASLSFTISQSLLKLMYIELMIPSNQLILCRPLLLLSSVFPSIRVFFSESALHIGWPKYWNFSFSKYRMAEMLNS